jgi:hypothetical protein
MNKPKTDPASLSRRLRYGAAGFFSLYLIAECLGWLAPHALRQVAPQLVLALQNVPLAQLDAMPLWQRVLGLMLALPALGALGAAVWQLNAVLRSFEQAAFFTPQVRRHFRRFAACLLAGTGLSMLEPTLRSAVFGLLLNPPGAGLTLEVDLNGSDLWTLLLCAVFYALAHILDEGQRLADENSGFV